MTSLTLKEKEYVRENTKPGGSPYSKYPQGYYICFKVWVSGFLGKGMLKSHICSCMPYTLIIFIRTICMALANLKTGHLAIMVGLSQRKRENLVPKEYVSFDSKPCRV